jgi:hypothetical protein
VHVVVAGVAVDGRDPAKVADADLRCQPANCRAGQCFQVETLGVLRRDYKARHCPPAVNCPAVAGSENLRLGSVDRTRNEVRELLALPGAKRASRPE